jgi:hypothetical protein
LVNSLGGGLSVVIRAEFRRHHNWMALAAWNSVVRNLPDAAPCLVVHRASPPPPELLTWPFRVGLRRVTAPSPGVGVNPLLHAAVAALKAGVAAQPLVVIDAAVMALREPPPGVMALFNRPGLAASPDRQVWYLSGRSEADLDGLVEGGGEPEVVYDLCAPAKDDAITVFSSYRDGVGKFVAANWIDRAEYPFPLADRLASPPMSANEAQVLKLWKLTHPVFDTVSRA